MKSVTLYVCTYEYVRTCQVKKGPYKGTYLCMNAFWIKYRGYKRTKLVKYFYGFINPVTISHYFPQNFVLDTKDVVFFSFGLYQVSYICFELK